MADIGSRPCPRHLEIYNTAPPGRPCPSLTRPRRNPTRVPVLFWPRGRPLSTSRVATRGVNQISAAALIMSDGRFRHFKWMMILLLLLQEHCIDSRRCEIMSAAMAAALH